MSHEPHLPKAAVKAEPRATPQQLQVLATLNCQTQSELP